MHNSLLCKNKTQINPSVWPFSVINWSRYKLKVHTYGGFRAFSEAVSWNCSDKRLHHEGSNYDLIWWDKYYDEVKESVNQDVLGGCGHLSLWTVRGARWGKKLSKYLFSWVPTDLKKRPGWHHHGQLWRLRIWSLGGGCFFSPRCLVQRTVSIQLRAARKWRHVSVLQISLALMWSQAAGIADDLI